jgi:hypothetical protein
MEDVRSFSLSIIPDQAKPFGDVLRELLYQTTDGARVSGWGVHLSPDELHRVGIPLSMARDLHKEGKAEEGWFYLVQAQKTMAHREGLMEAAYESSDEAAARRVAAKNGAIGGRTPKAELLASRQRVTASILAIHSQNPFRFTADFRQAMFDLEDGKGKDENWFRRTLQASPKLTAVYATLTKKKVLTRTKAGQ